MIFICYRHIIGQIKQVLKSPYHQLIGPEITWSRMLVEGGGGPGVILSIMDDRFIIFFCNRRLLFNGIPFKSSSRYLYIQQVTRVVYVKTQLSDFTSAAKNQSMHNTRIYVINFCEMKKYRCQILCFMYICWL